MSRGLRRLRLPEDPSGQAGPGPLRSLNRSCNQVLILATLSSGPRHGYQLALKLEDKSDGIFRFQHGTLYPILHRLESEGSVPPPAPSARKVQALVGTSTWSRLPRIGLVGARSDWAHVVLTRFKEKP